MKPIEFSSDRTINSTDNNEYSEGYRDETLVDENLVDAEIPLDDMIPDAVNELSEDDRPLYNEEGYRKNIGE